MYERLKANSSKEAYEELNLGWDDSLQTCEKFSKLRIQLRCLSGAGRLQHVDAETGLSSASIED
jgi:hypothetical protein